MRLALVTGGLRRVGAAIARQLAEDGWALALHAAHPHPPEPELAAALERNVTRWRSFTLDFAVEPAERLLGEVIAAFGAPPALIVNNASRFGDDDAASADAASIAAYHRVNAAAPVELALALHRARAGGSIVNIVDQRVRNPVPDQLSYGLSKAALAASTRTLAIALAPALRVNAVAPGLTLPTDDYTAAQLARVTAAMPLGRLPSPGDVAAAVLFLAKAEAVTGETLFVDGGASLRGFERDFASL